MTENYDHYISNHIKSVYRNRLIAPFLYIVLLIIFWAVCPLSDLLFPDKLTDFDDLKSFYRDGNAYITTDLRDLYFTGYTNTHYGKTTGYYYYTLWNGRCVLVLLSPATSEEGLPHVKKAHVRGRILEKGSAYQKLLDSLAEDLSWTFRGIQSKTSPYIISEPAFGSSFGTFLIVLYFATGACAVLAIIIYVLYIIFPVLSPPCRRLGRFGRPALLLSQAEEELATLPQLATEDMFITEHYFIEIAACGIAIVPIPEILWIYKYSTLHKFFWYHFNISYTLHITAGRHLYIQCPKNMKSDIDGIIDYLSEANHDILIGFSEENRKKVQELQKPSVLLEQLTFLLQMIKGKIRR